MKVACVADKDNNHYCLLPPPPADPLSSSPAHTDYLASLAYTKAHDPEPKKKHEKICLELGNTLHFSLNFKVKENSNANKRIRKTLMFF